MTRRLARFGLLTARTTNLGDDIQALAALQYLPGVRQFLDRDSLARSSVEPGTSVVMNGWWTNYPESLPTRTCGIDPLLTSIHVARSGILSRTGTTVTAALMQPRILSILRELGPVGCRDTATVNLLTGLGVEAHFSGCLTLTLRRSGRSPGGGREVLAVDLPRQLAASVRHGTDRPVLRVTNGISSRAPTRERLVAARHRLLQIEGAHAVVTTRLHVALPCLALGTPVLWVVPEPPEGRTKDYRDWVHTTTPGGLPEAMRERAGGWPENPGGHVGTARRLSAAVEAWVAVRSAVSAETSTDPQWVSDEILTGLALDRWADLDRDASRRVRMSALAKPQRALHRRRLVADPGSQPSRRQ